MPEDAEPGQIPNWRDVLRSCSRETNATARMWLYYTLFYWLVPTAIALFGLLVGRKEIQPGNFIIHGEFLIYAITLTAASTRLIAKDSPNSGPFVHRQAFNLISHVMILPAIFIYGLVRYIGATSDPNSINTCLIIWYSIILLIAAFVFSYVVFKIDAQRGAPGEIQKRAGFAITHSSDKLNSDFDQMQYNVASNVEDTTKSNLEGQFDSLKDGL